jgi:hypothetical protein
MELRDCWNLDFLVIVWAHPRRNIEQLNVGQAGFRIVNRASLLALRLTAFRTAANRYVFSHLLQ